MENMEPLRHQQELNLIYDSSLVKLLKLLSLKFKTKVWTSRKLKKQVNSKCLIKNKITYMKKGRYGFCASLQERNKSLSDKAKSLPKGLHVLSTSCPYT